ncbi:MAG: hypothetical protein AVDCRST_MAG75-3271, partial [uncultured Propionibacteriaceae bacterium]
DRPSRRRRPDQCRCGAWRAHARTRRRAVFHLRAVRCAGLGRPHPRWRDRMDGLASMDGRAVDTCDRCLYHRPRHPHGHLRRPASRRNRIGRHGCGGPRSSGCAGHQCISPVG